MDPITGVSFTAAVVQLVQFSLKLAKTAHEIKERGSSSDVANVSALSQQVAALSISVQTSLQDPAVNTPTLTPEEKQLVSLGKKCEDVATTLRDEVRRLIASDDAPAAKRLKLAGKTAWKKRKVDDMMKELDGFREVLEMGLLSRLRLLMNTSSQKFDVQALRTNGHLDALDEASKRIAAGLADSRIEIAQLVASESAQTRHHITAEIVRMEKTRIDDRFLDDFKKSLFFPEIFARQEHIDHEFDGIPDSNRWIFYGLNSNTPDSADSDDYSNDGSDSLEHDGSTSSFSDNSSLSEMEPTWDSFSDWLSEGSGIYWISGKAGAGKSTLMSYICSHTAKDSLLMQWSGTRRLLTPTFFFWNAGTRLQKSVDGLLRSLVYQMINECPELISCIKHRDLHIWTHKRLIETFKLLLQTASTLAVCIFIDGLDEFEGRYEPVVTTMNELEDSQNVKICVSSRPNSNFEVAFAGSRKLRLHELTATSIHKYARARLLKALQPHHFFSDSELQHLEGLRSRLVMKAEGVFLWVVLAIRQLCDGIRDLVNLKTLEDQIDGLHPGIEDLYRQLLDRIQPAYQPDASKFFRFALFVDERVPQTIRMWVFLDRCWRAEPGPAVTLHEDEQQARTSLEVMRKRITSHTQGLIGVGPFEAGILPEEWSSYPIKIFHKTFKDFLLDNPAGREFLAKSELQAGQAMLALARASWHYIFWSLGTKSHHISASIPYRCGPAYAIERLLGYAFEQLRDVEDIGDVTRVDHLLQSITNDVANDFASLLNLLRTSWQVDYIKDLTGLAAYFHLQHFPLKRLGLTLSAYESCDSSGEAKNGHSDARTFVKGAFKCENKDEDNLQHDVGPPALAQDLDRSGVSVMDEKDHPWLPHIYILICYFEGYNRVDTRSEIWQDILRLSSIILSAGAPPMAQINFSPVETQSDGRQPVSIWTYWLHMMFRLSHSLNPHPDEVESTLCAITQLLIDRGSDVDCFVKSRYLSLFLPATRLGKYALFAFDFEMSGLFILKEDVSRRTKYMDAWCRMAKKPATKRILSLSITPNYYFPSPIGTIKAQVSSEQSDLLWQLFEDLGAHDRNADYGDENARAESERTQDILDEKITHIFSSQHPSVNFAEIPWTRILSLSDPQK